METDRELLELAAKAAGIPIHVWGAKGRELVADMTDPGNHKLWNPLTDDGEALRLAVKLDLDILHRQVGGNRVEIVPPCAKVTMEFLEKDRLSATRRAIVRAAAEIGRAQVPAHTKGEKA